MPSRNIIPKQGNAKALRAKRKREPQVHENAKTAIIIKGRKTSQDVTDALKDIVSALIGPGLSPTLALGADHTTRWCYVHPLLRLRQGEELLFAE